MYWKLSASEFKSNVGNANKQRARKLIGKGVIPGIIAYDGEKPIGWCAVEPRENYPRLAGSRILSPVDDKPVWSVVCLFVEKSYRRRGVSTLLLKAAVKHVRDNGGRIIEGYPVDASGLQPDAWVWTGLKAAFDRAGFNEVARRSPTRPIMRKHLKSSS